jgi:hypothetical protein
MASRAIWAQSDDCLRLHNRQHIVEDDMGLGMILLTGRYASQRCKLGPKRVANPSQSQLSVLRQYLCLGYTK